MKSVLFIVILLVIASGGIRLPSESDDCSVRDHSKTPPLDPNAPSFEDSDFGLSTGQEESPPPRGRRGRAGRDRHAGVRPGRAVPADTGEARGRRGRAGRARRAGVRPVRAVPAGQRSQDSQLSARTGGQTQGGARHAGVRDRPVRDVPAGQESPDSRLSVGTGGQSGHAGRADHAGVPVRDGSQVRQDSLESSAGQAGHVAEDELAEPQIGIPANVHVAPHQAAALGLPPHHWVYNRVPSGSLTVGLLVGNPPTFIFNRYGSKARSEKVYFRYSHFFKH